MKLYEVLNKQEEFILVKKDHDLYIDKEDFDTLTVEDQEELLNSSVNEIIEKPNLKIFELSPSLKELQERLNEINKQKKLKNKPSSKSILKYIVLLPVLLIIKGLLLALQLILMPISFFLSVAGGLVSMLANGVALLVSFALILALVTEGLKTPLLGFALGIGISLIFGLIPSLIAEGISELSHYLSYLNSMIDIKPENK